MLKIHKKRMICLSLILLISCQAFSQIVINVILNNTDKALLAVLTEKLAINTAIMAQQTLIHTGLKNIRDSKKKTRAKYYEINKYDKKLNGAVAKNLALNNLVLGAPIVSPSAFPLYATDAKIKYFTRELLISQTINALMLNLKDDEEIKNINSHDLHSVNRKMLTQLKENKNHAYKNAAFVIVASLLSNVAIMSSSELDEILSLGL